MELEKDGTQIGQKTRVIMHLDMDAFFVNVELLAQPHLRGKLIIVAHEGPRSVVCSASYEARTAGVHSGMPLARAKNLSPQAVVLPLRGDYRRYSQAVMSILRNESPLVEQVSVDEAFVDLTGAMTVGGSAVDIARRVRERISQELSLPCSAGISVNKFLAKMASTCSKPNGLWVVPPRKVHDFLDPMPVTRLWGVGERSASALNRYGIVTVAQLRTFELGWLQGRFGRAAGSHLYDLARGIDNRPVQTERSEKSMGAEHTFAADTRSSAQVEQVIYSLSMRLGERLRAANKIARGLSLKYRYEGFETHTKSVLLTDPADSGMSIYRAACKALYGAGVISDRSDGEDMRVGRPLRLVGVRADRLEDVHGGVQRPLLGFDLIAEGGDVNLAVKGGVAVSDWSHIERTLDGIKARFSPDVVRPASLMKAAEQRAHMSRVHR